MGKWDFDKENEKEESTIQDEGGVDESNFFHKETPYKITIPFRKKSSVEKVVVPEAQQPVRKSKHGKLEITVMFLNIVSVITALALTGFAPFTSSIPQEALLAYLGVIFAFISMNNLALMVLITSHHKEA